MQVLKRVQKTLLHAKPSRPVLVLNRSSCEDGFSLVRFLKAPEADRACSAGELAAITAVTSFSSFQGSFHTTPGGEGEEGGEGVQARAYLHSRNLNHKHGCSQDVAGMVTPELDSRHLLNFMEVDGFDFVHAFLQVCLGVQHVICRYVAEIVGDMWIQFFLTSQYTGMGL